MLLEVTLLSVMLACGGREPEMKPVKLPPGPNLKTPSPTTTEPYQVVFPKRVSWSPDGGVAHYQLLYKNRKSTPKAGWTVIGFFVDASTGKTLATYNWETKGFMCPSLAPLWKKGRSRAWAEKFLKDHGFVAPDKRHKRTIHPDRNSGISLKLTVKKTRIGWISSARALKRFFWQFSTVWRKTTAEDKVDARIQLQMKKKGVKGVTMLHTHQPYLDYHYSLTHTHNWKQAVMREEGDTPTICEPGTGPENPECRKKMKKHGLSRRDRFPFTGEVWIYWNPKGDALMAFWDDRQVRGLDTPEAHGIYRSYVTVHALAPRQPSPLVAKLAAAAPAPSAMAVGGMDAMGTMGARGGMDTMGAAAGKSAGMDQMMGTPGGMADSGSKQGAKKKGCGCAAEGNTAFGGLALLALVLFGLVRRSRRRAT